MSTIPQVPDVSNELSSLSESVLKSFLSDEDAFLSFIERHNYSLRVQNILDGITENNRAAAENILSKESDINEVQQQLSQLRSRHDSLFQEFQNLSKELNSKFGSNAAKSELIQELDSELEDAKSKADEIDMKFVDGHLAVSDYVKSGVDIHKNVSRLRFIISSLND
ncbi:hypothetical protein P9112_003996 [Eukaryota sp. TZLM1-RC]